MAKQQLNRRGFFGRASALAALGGSLEALHGAQLKPGARPRNIIWMVADGMSPSVLPLADHFSQLIRGKGILWQALLDRPEAQRGWMDEASLDSLVTDSSSSASCWGSGSRIFNGWVNVLPDGTGLTPIADLARHQRKRVGLVTTATVTHATPAGFAASVKHRDDEHIIAEQYLDRVDVILGGGRRFFDPSARADKRDMIAAFRQKGYGCAPTRGDLAKLGSARMLGLFSASHLPYSIDRRADQAAQDLVPTLAEMTSAALNALSHAPNGFLLQVEGGRVDHAAHANDAAALLWDMLAFDEAVETVLQFTEKHPETLVVVTSDHGNANPGLVGMGTEYTESTRCFERLAHVNSSFYAISPRLGGTAEYTMKATGVTVPAKPVPTAERVQELARYHFGFDLAADEIDVLRKAGSGTKKLSINRQLDSLSSLMGQVVGNHTGIGWTGSTHTSDYTLLTALGPGAERFTGFVRNTEIFPHLTALMDVEFKNPSMDPVKARQFKEAAGVLLRRRPDWA
ncbi:alkaline phosphatase [uncultured Paludibaculum sp.]|uniref:alkaline phosphatase n=1 Tax=uncultured Paludibaculum sp. TaxID=1765020 RepID=UPI002AAAC415|nr:alkaline phosphatase [uncultured Paludibaculum sp.]